MWRLKEARDGLLLAIDSHVGLEAVTLLALAAADAKIAMLAASDQPQRAEELDIA